MFVMWGFSSVLYRGNSALRRVKGILEGGVESPSAALEVWI